MENIDYPVKKPNVAEISYNGVSYKFRVPPLTGTHSECYKALNKDTNVRIAQGLEIAVYAAGALYSKRKKEWLNQDLIKFPSKTYLRVPAVLTMIPKRSKFGDLQGGMLVDSDLNGEWLTMQTRVPKSLEGWTVNDAGLYVQDNRIFVPYETWFNEQLDANNKTTEIALFTREGAELLERVRVDSKRDNAPLWKYNVNQFKTPKIRVLSLNGFDDRMLGLYFGYDDFGCAIGVLK